MANPVRSGVNQQHVRGVSSVRLGAINAHKRHDEPVLLSHALLLVQSWNSRIDVNGEKTCQECRRIYESGNYSQCMLDALIGLSGIWRAK